jgi:hypothetical protein
MRLLMLHPGFSDLSTKDQVKRNLNKLTKDKNGLLFFPLNKMTSSLILTLVSSTRFGSKGVPKQQPAFQQDQLALPTAPTTCNSCSAKVTARTGRKTMPSPRRLVEKWQRTDFRTFFGT